MKLKFILRPNTVFVFNSRLSLPVTIVLNGDKTEHHLAGKRKIKIAKLRYLIFLPFGNTAHNVIE